MVLFIFSLILIFISSYLILCVLKPKENATAINYLFLIAFAQIILSFETLSLFTAISEKNILCMNFLFLAGSIILYFVKGKPAWKPIKNNLITRIFNSLKLDKSLRILLFGFCIFIISAIYLCAVMPVNNGDALGYHVARCLFWIAQRSLSHFPVSDIRLTSLPINSELLYTWTLLFFKKDVGIGFFAFTAYALTMMNVFTILGELGYCVRKKLWTILILSALPSVLIQASTTETDIIIAWLVGSSFILFWKSLKNNQKQAVYMSALAFAIAVGTKPTSIMMIPSVGIFFIILASHYKQYKKLLLFFLFGILNFAIFSSYNYILNFIDFSNPMGLQSFIAVNKNTFGLKGAISNFIKHMFMFINFVGFKWGIYLEPWLANIRNQIMMFFHVAHLPDSNYTATGKLLAQPYDPTTAAGILGFLVYIPCVIRSLFSFKPLHKKRFYLSIFGVTFFINIFAISYLMNYSSFDCRYLVAFIIFSSPVLVYSYNAKFKPYKYLVIIFALYSSIFISTNLSQRPVFKITRILKNQNSSQTTLQDTLYTNFPYHFIKKYIINNVPHGAKILVFANKDEEVYLLKSIDFSGYKTDFKLLEKASEIDFNKYDIIVIADNSQLSYFRTIVVPENGISCRYGYQYPGYERILTKCTINKSFFTEKNFLLICTLELNKKDKIYTYYIYKNATNKN